MCSADVYSTLSDKMVPKGTLSYHGRTRLSSRVLFTLHAYDRGFHEELNKGSSMEGEPKNPFL